MLTARSLLYRHSRALVRANHSVVPSDTKEDNSQLVPEVPIKGLDLVKRIRKVKKTGSFTVDFFTGSYDHDFLTYPEPLDNRIENQQLKEQAKMVKQMWPQYWDDPKELQRFNFFNLFQLSVTEMMTIFEAIGASTRKCFEVKLPATNYMDSSLILQSKVSQSIVNLIIRNCLTYWPIFNSENPHVKEILPKQHIIFGKPQDTQNIFQPIGFCWTEKASGLGSLPPQEWLTLGMHGGSSSDFYSIQGAKVGVLYQDPMDYYLVFYRDKFLSEQFKDNMPLEEPNPASDPFIGCCLVDRSSLNHGPIYTDSAGIKYTDVGVDATVPGRNSVFAAERKDTKGVNIKALGQLASCSVVLGILKDSLNLAYQHLLESKEGLLNCDIIERKLVSVTGKIFAIESMVYYVAGMYDGLEDGFDAHLEATIIKIVTNEYAYEALQELQQVFGSRMFILSKLQDQINIFDSFLDGNIYNRLYLATMGVLWYARNRNVHLNQLRLAPWYPGYFVKYAWRETAQKRDWFTLDADILGNLHPSLKEAGMNLQFILTRVKHVAESLCMRHGKDVTGAQSRLYDMAQLSIDSFLLTTMCARASKSYCLGSRNSDIDVAMATHFSRELVRRTRLYVDTIDRIDDASLFNKASVISEANLKWGGYYAESPLDPNI